jgi:hypothetical protein
MTRSRSAVLVLAAVLVFMGVHVDDGHVALSGVANAQRACSDSMPPNTAKCVIKVDAALQDGACRVGAIDPEFLTMSNSGHRNVTIVWRLGRDNGDFVFCRRQGDGVALKSSAHQQHGQVNRTWAADNAAEEDSEPDQSACKKRFRWNFKNKQDSDAPTGTQYDYLIRFRHKDGARCIVDPWIRNGSVTILPDAKRPR